MRLPCADGQGPSRPRSATGPRRATRAVLLAIALLSWAAVALLVVLRRDASDAPAPVPPRGDREATSPPVLAVAAEPASPVPTRAPTAGDARDGSESVDAPAIVPRFDFVDAWDGRPLDVSVDLVLTARSVARSATGDGGFAYDARMGVNPPEGYVDWERLDASRSWADERIARHARSAWVVHPLYREALVRVALVGSDGHPAQGARVRRFRVEGRSGDARTEDLGNGLVRLRGIPFVPGGRLDLEAGWDPSADGGAPAELPVEGPRLSIVLPTSPREEVRGAIVLPARPAAILDQEWLETDNDMPFEESLGRGEDEGSPRETGTLAVSVRRRDGHPAPGARVRVTGSRAVEGAADADGVARFAGVGVGSVVVALREPGLVPSTETARVVAGEPNGVVLQEEAGGTLEVAVRHESGPASFARLRIVQPSGVAWLDVSDDGVQRLDAFVGLDGTRWLHRLEPGETEVHAEWHGRRAKTRVRMHEGATLHVVLVLSAP